MSDQAPVSSLHVRYALFRTSLPGPVVDRLEITTSVCPSLRALTHVQRPVSIHQPQTEVDQVIQDALRGLPGADSAIVMTMGRTFTVEWTGVCQPI